ncbi:MAG: tetratricopeptide repeat protein, partial [Rhodothermales bacterium]
MHVSFVPASSRSRLTAALMALLLVVLGCGSDTERDEQRGPDRTGVDPRAAGYLVEAQKAFQTGDIGTALAQADSAEQHAGQSGGEGAGEDVGLSGARGDATFLADVTFLRGRIYSELHDTDAAQHAYQRVLSLVPNYRGAYMNLGNNAFRNGQFKRAVGYYEQENEAHDDPRVKVYKGRAYLELGYVDSARLAFEAAIDQGDSIPEAHARLARLFDQNGDTEAALPHARRALEQEPDNADYRYLIGSMLLRTGAVEEAVATFRQVVEQDPNHSEGYYGLGRALADLDQLDEASRFLAVADSLQRIEDGLREYETKTRLYPEDPAAWATYGYALYRAGRDAEAMQAFQTVLHIDPGNVEVRFGVANLFLKHRDVERALEEYNAILQQDDTFVPAWINAGIALARIGQDDAARDAWEAALR